MTEEESTHSAFSKKMHTAYKHEILKKYLPAWMQILQSENRTLAYVDCYAGPGVYPDGTKGSPHIALDVAESISSKYGCHVWCIFNDCNKAMMDQLLDSLRGRNDVDKVIVFSSQTDASDLTDEILKGDHFSKNGLLQVPMFFFIDPFGLNVPMVMLKKIMNQSKTEILVTFMIKDIVRWSRTDPYVRTMKELFDYPNPITLIEQISGIDYEQCAVNAFVARLREYADVKYVIRYRVCSQDERRTLFYMVHGTNHFKGFQVMKGIMYNIGIPGVFAYLGPDHPDQCQTQLDTWNSDIENLMNHLIQAYSGISSTYQQILERIYVETPYVEKHIREALRSLETKGLVRLTGHVGMRGGFKPDTIFEFFSSQ